jgi:hypothetical protein
MGPTPSANVRPLLAAAAPDTTLSDTWISGTTSSSSRQQQQQFVPRSHMAVLSDASGWLFHTGLGLWMCVQPGVHDAAGQAPRPGGFAQAGSGADADAERMRCSSAAAAQGCGAAGVRPPLPQPGEGAWQRRQAQLELVKAQSLGDAAGYERWLRVLAHLLAQQRDEVGGLAPMVAMPVVGRCSRSVTSKAYSSYTSIWYVGSAVRCVTSRGRGYVSGQCGLVVVVEE